MKIESPYPLVFRCADRLEVFKNNFLYLAAIVMTYSRHESHYPEVFRCADHLEVFKKSFSLPKDDREDILPTRVELSWRISMPRSFEKK